MNSTPDVQVSTDRQPQAVPPEAVAPAASTPGITLAPARAGQRAFTIGLAVLSLIALLLGIFLWQKLSSIQEHLARQSADAGALSVEARALARQAQELSHETAARVAVFEARLSEVSVQRGQIEELMQSLARSRDENLVVDIESALRLAQQQASLTGSAEPLLAALKSAEQRVGRAAQPRLAGLQRAIVRDIDRVKSTAFSDTSALLVKLDEVVRLADELVIANAVAPIRPLAVLNRPALDGASAWWRETFQLVLDEFRSLVRVSRVQEPEAALLSPEQSFFLRENFKLKLLNARLGLLARQLESSRSDVAAALNMLNKYFDAASRKTQTASSLLKQVQVQMMTLQLPRVDESLAALSAAAAGR